MSTPADSRPVYSVVGDRYTFLLTGEDTGGAYAVFDAWVPAGGGTPRHLHTREDEDFLVMDGELEFTVAGGVRRLRSGEHLHAPRGIPHSFRNVSSTPTRLLITVSPAGLEHFFAEIGHRLPNREAAPLAMSDADKQKLVETIGRYGMQLA